LRAALADDTWDFMLAEQAFGGRDAQAWKSLSLEAGEERLTLRGTIDRIDRARGGRALRVVDYKRSQSTVRGAATSLGETALQVPIYACVSSREFGLPATGTYLPFQPRDLMEATRVSASSSSKPSKAQKLMDELIARAPDEPLAPVERRAVEIALLARRGGLAPVPADETECQVCAVSGGCRKPRFAMTASEEEGEVP
jgi:RecB family exonuclease